MSTKYATSTSAAAFGSGVLDFLLSAQSELLMLAVAMFGYLVLFLTKAPQNTEKLSLRRKLVEEEGDNELSIRGNRTELRVSAQASRIVAPALAKDDDCQSEFHNQEALLEKYAAERNIKDALCTFRAIELRGARLSCAMYNAVLKAWINCGNVQAAEDCLEEAKVAGMANATSFDIVMKALLRFSAFERCHALLNDMEACGLQPSVASYNELLSGLAEVCRSDEGVRILEKMHADGQQLDSFTFNVIGKLLNGLRNTDDGFSRIRNLVHKYDLVSRMPSTVPRLAAVVLQAERTVNTSYTHEVHILGTLARVKATRRTLKQDGFFDGHDRVAWPLDGVWETEHGLTVTIEGKMVRWSRQRASRLRFAGPDRRTCLLRIYGELSQGTLVSPALVPGASKSLQWNNGDVWHAYEGQTMGPISICSQSMTKISRDNREGLASRARSRAMLKCVSSQGLCLPEGMEDTILQFIGSNLYYFQVRFQSTWNPSSMDAHEAEEDICVSISRRHPRVGLRHCWAEQSAEHCGQRTVIFGDEVDEHCFNRFIKAVRVA